MMIVLCLPDRRWYKVTVYRPDFGHCVLEKYTCCIWSNDRESQVTRGQAVSSPAVFVSLKLLYCSDNNNVEISRLLKISNNLKIKDAILLIIILC